MNFGTPPEAAPAAQGVLRKPGDANIASPDTEDVSPPDSAGAGSPPYVLPLTPRNVELEAMAEEDNEEEREGGGARADSSNPQLDEAGSAGGKGGGRKRRRVVVASTAAMDLGSFAARGAGGSARWVFLPMRALSAGAFVYVGTKEEDSVCRVDYHGEFFSCSSSQSCGVLCQKELSITLQNTDERRNQRRAAKRRRYDTLAACGAARRRNKKAPLCVCFLSAVLFCDV